METNAAYKFEPIWVSVLSITALVMSYNFLKGFIARPSYDVPGLIFMSAPLVLSLLFLPMGVKMLLGIPAITFTHDQLIDNVFGIKIDWENVQNVRLSGSRKPFLTIDLKDTDKFYSSINNPLKRIAIRMLFALSPGDASVNLAFVAGDNHAIVAVTQVYWEKHYQPNI
ncbi:hypothetical protein [Mucilaginibacter sp. UYCu711]|uniref:hypothetical protein n=1 Tax=Mucilaginibacter sp. UYCu711 TaxID=3156339 RepID=UPI003D1B57A5